MRTRNLCSLWLVSLCVVSATALSACDKAGRGASSAEGESHPLVGSPAPSFDLPAQSGGARAALTAAKGKVVVVDFWATWCEPCKDSFPKYEALAKKFGDKVAIIGISEDEAPDGITAFASETGATFLLAWDGDKSVAGTYQTETMPTSFIVDQNGLVRYVHSGFRAGDESVVEAKIQDLLSQ